MRKIRVTGAGAAKHKTAALRKAYKAFSEKVGLKEKLNRTGEAQKKYDNNADKEKRKGLVHRKESK